MSCPAVGIGLRNRSDYLNIKLRRPKLGNYISAIDEGSFGAFGDRPKPLRSNLFATGCDHTAVGRRRHEDGNRDSRAFGSRVDHQSRINKDGYPIA